MHGAAPLGDDRIGSVVANNWGLTVESVEYLPIGYGSFHWLARSPGPARWLVTADTNDGPFAVAGAYQVARQLADHGLEFVRAPLLTATSSVVVAVDRWVVSVWPWLEGDLRPPAVTSRRLISRRHCVVCAGFTTSGASSLCRNSLSSGSWMVGNRLFACLGVRAGDRAPT